MVCLGEWAAGGAGAAPDGLREGRGSGAGVAGGTRAASGGVGPGAGGEGGVLIRPLSVSSRSISGAKEDYQRFLKRNEVGEIF